MRLAGSLTVAALLPVLYAQDGGAVEGIVVNAVTAVGIGGATVRLTFRQDHYETVTDGAGEFRISGIKPGDYVALAEKATYSVPPSQALRRTQVHIGSGKEPVRLRFELLPPATLRGRVFGIDGNPAVRAKVDVGGGQVKTTGDDGSFVFENLPSGSYTLVARPQASASRVQDGVRTEILPTYFPSVLDLSAAQEIRLQPGADQAGYDIRLQAAPVYRLRGVVLDPSGKPSAKAVVGIVSKASGRSARGFVSVPYGPFAVTDGPPRTHDSLIEPAVTGSDGAFEFPSVPAGDWILRAESDTVHDEARQRDVNLYGAEAITLGRGDIDDMKIQLGRAFDLPVSFELSDGSPAPENLSLQVALIPQEGARPEVGSRPQSGARAGPPRIENVQPGQYLIQGRMLFDYPYYAARIFLGDADVTGQAVELSPASPPIRVILKTAATLRGVAKDCVEGAVIVWPQSTAPGDFGKAIPCGAGGNFETRGLAPGDYYALAVDRYDPREMTTAAYLRGMVSKATSVRIEEGASASLELSLR